MFSNGKSILVQPIQKDDLIINSIDSRLIDIQQKITDLLSAGYTIYDVASATNNSFNNLIAFGTSENKICVWKSAGSSAYTVRSTEFANNGYNVVVNAVINNMNQVTAIRDCALTCTASSGLFANLLEFYGGDWYLASWTTGSNIKFANCDVIAHTSEVYMPDVNFEYCNVRFKKSGTIAYSTYKENVDTRFVNETTAGSTVSTLTISYAYTTVSDWFTRCTLVDWQNTGAAVISSTVSRTINFTGLKIENSNLTMTNVYTTAGSKIYYEGQDIALIGTAVGTTWAQLGTTNISSSSGLYPSLAFNQSGIPYVAYQDNSSTTGITGKASCMKYGSTGWQVVGYSGFSTGLLTSLTISISSTDGIAIIGKTTNNNVDAYFYSESASSWGLLGSAGFSTSIVDLLVSSYSTDGVFNAIYTNTSGRIIEAYRYIIINGTSMSWVNLDVQNSSVGYAGSSVVGLSINKANNFYTYTSNIIGFSFINNELAVVVSGLEKYNVTTSTYGLVSEISSFNNYCVLINGSSKPTLTSWSNSSIGVIGSSQFSTGTAQKISLSLINSIPYVAIEDTTAKASVYKYVSANSSWSLIGSANFSTENIGRLQLASWNNVPYLVIEEKAAPGIALYKFDEVTSDSNINYSFENLEDDIFDGEKSLDITSIQSTSSYLVQNCNVRPIYNITDTAVGRFVRNAYNIDLTTAWNAPVDDSLKETNPDTFWIVLREDIETILDGMIIKNLKLYDSGLNLYNYRSNDNFIIIANNPTKGNAVFCFYNGKIKGTVFSDWFLDVSYTITDCFILMEVNEINELQNKVTGDALEDSPLENGSILFNSYDNEILN